MIHLPKIEIEKKPQSPFMTRKKLMETMSISPSTLHKWIKEKGLKYYKVNQKVFFKTEEFNHWFENYSINTEM